uniref:Secreted protein n=1 Tax=Rhipicephalus appendiculatus TaxID=34631 RepID=A0A131YB18_RHIAP
MCNMSVLLLLQMLNVMHPLFYEATFRKPHLCRVPRRQVYADGYAQKSRRKYFFGSCMPNGATVATRSQIQMSSKHAICSPCLQCLVSLHMNQQLRIEE